MSAPSSRSVPGSAPLSASSSAAAFRAPATICAASFRSPASVRLASFDAFAAILTPFAGHHRQAAQPRERAHVQDPVEQVLRQPGLREQVPAEPGERRMVRDQPPARDPERRVIPAAVLHRPGGQHPAQVRVHPHGQQHHRVIPGRACRRPLRSRRHQPGSQVPRHELLNRVDNDPDSMALRHPVEHVMGQKHLGITVNRLELVCHKPILPAITPVNRETKICNSPPGVPNPPLRPDPPR